MSFVKLVKLIGINDTKLGASMSMRIYNSSPKPVAFLSLRKHFLATTNFGDALKFDVAIGEGDSAGKIRITASKSGIFSGRQLQKGSVVIDLGHIPALGDAEHKNRSAEVVFVDGAAIVTVPDWQRDVEDDDDGDGDDDDRPSFTSSKPAAAAPRETYNPATPPRAASAAAGPKAATHKGITINLSAGNESVSYRGNTIEVSPRGAKLVEMLAKVTPACIGDAAIVGRLWETKPSSSSAATLLDMVCADLGSLKKIGLELRTQRGIGRQIVEVKA